MRYITVIAVMCVIVAGVIGWRATEHHSTCATKNAIAAAVTCK